MPPAAPDRGASLDRRTSPVPARDAGARARYRVARSSRGTRVRAGRIAAAHEFAIEVSAADPLALVGACGLLLVVAVAAAFVPPRWATKVDPAQVMRAD